MISLKKAQELVWKNTHRLPGTLVRIEQAFGRTLSEDIKVRFDTPPFDRAAMDGYAVRAKDTASAHWSKPVILQVTGDIQAGQKKQWKLLPGQAISIMTGACLPAGADAVVMLEKIKVTETGRGRKIQIFQPVVSGENVSFRGEDLHQGQTVLKKGQVVNSAVLAMLAYTGKAWVKVVRKPEVAIMATGDELKKPGNRITGSYIYDANSYGLLGQVLKSGGNPHLLGIARDNISDLSHLIKRGLNYDILLISGGVSEGKYDLVVKVLRTLKVKPVFWKVAIKPGKPVFFGCRGKKLVFGLPGYPVSSYLNFEVLVRWAIAGFLGQPRPEPVAVTGILMQDVENAGDREALIRVCVTAENEENLIFPYPRQKSGILSSIVETNGLLCLEKGAQVHKGERVTVQLLNK